MLRSLMGLVMLGAVGGGGVFVLSQQQPPVATGFRQVTVSAEAARSFDDKVKAVQATVDEAIRTGKATPVEVTFNEEELTSKIAEAAKTVTGGLVTSGTQINLQGGNIVATSSVSLQGINVNVGIVATPIVEGGQTRIVVKEIQTGAIPLPDALKQQIESQVGVALDPKSLGLPFDISKLTIANGQIVIAGTAKP
jgi:hypothetical protein